MAILAGASLHAALFKMKSATQHSLSAEGTRATASSLGAVTAPTTLSALSSLAVASPEADVVPIPSSVVGMSPPVHDPHTLLARADQAVFAGEDVRILRIRLSASALDRLTSSRLSRIVPQRQGDRTVGVRVQGIAPDSPASDVGLENGDLLTAINGYALERPEVAIAAYESARRDRMAVIELVRRGRRVVLSLSWPVR
jgi:S1-C subfamily serine protease